MKRELLQEILMLHKLWLEGHKEGKRADLRGADLSGADLRGADLSGATGVFSVGPTPTSGRMVYFVRHEYCIMVQAGCFWGTTVELAKKVSESHKCPVYLAAINMIESMWAPQ